MIVFCSAILIVLKDINSWVNAVVLTISVLKQNSFAFVKGPSIYDIHMEG